MATRTIRIPDEVYERLAAEKREDESFTETVARLLDVATADWRHGFGRYAGSAGRELQQVVDDVQGSHAEGFAGRQAEVLEAMGFDLDERGNVTSVPDEAEERS